MYRAGSFMTSYCCISCRRAVKPEYLEIRIGIPAAIAAKAYVPKRYIRVPPGCRAGSYIVIPAAVCRAMSMVKYL